MARIGEDRESAVLGEGVDLGGARVFLKNKKIWAKIVMIILTALAITSAFLDAYTEIVWHVTIILAGDHLLSNTIRHKTM